MVYGPLIDLPFLNVYTEDGANVLVDGDMEAPTCAAYTPTGGAVLSKELNPRPGSLGVQCMRVMALAAGEKDASQGVMNLNGWYHNIGWARGDGVTVRVPGLYLGGNNIWNGTSSATWQPIDVIGQQTVNAIIYLYTNGGVAGWCEFDDFQILPINTKTRNIGVLWGGVQLGNGNVSSTFPTFQGGGKRGAIFNGTQYAQWPFALASATYSVAISMRPPPMGVAGYLLDARGGGGTGWMYVDASGVLSSTSGTYYVNGMQTTATQRGMISSIVCSGITLSAPSYLELFAAFNTGAPWTGTAYGFKLFAGTLTLAQIRAIHERSMMEINA